MQRQDIEIEILPDGNVEYTIKGIRGSSCENISELLEQLGQVEHEERTGEYYERDNESNLHVSR